MTAGEDFVKKIKPFGCVLFLALFVGFLVLRTEHELSAGLRKKVANFCNVSPDAVVQSIDQPTIYEVPLRMQEQELDATILRKLDMPVGETPGLGPWRNFLDRRHKATKVGFLPVVGNVALAVLVRIKRPRVNINVGVELLNGNVETSGLQQFADRR